MSKASPEVADQERVLLEALGKRMRHRRESLRNGTDTDKLGIVELAERAGLSHSYVSRLERGLVPRPTLPELAAVARALDISPQTLLYGEMAGTDEAELRRILRHDDLRESFADIADGWEWLNPADRTFLAASLKALAERARAATLAGVKK